MPTFVSSAEIPLPTVVQPPTTSTSLKQMRSTMEYIEIMVGQNTAQYFRHCKENCIGYEDPMYSAWLILATKVNCHAAESSSKSTNSHANKRKRKPKHYLSYISESFASEENQEPVQEAPSMTGEEEILESETIFMQQPESPVASSPLRLLQEPVDLLEQQKPVPVSSSNIIPPDPHRSLLQKSSNLIPPHPKKSLLQSRF